MDEWKIDKFRHVFLLPVLKNARRRIIFAAFNTSFGTVLFNHVRKNRQNIFCLESVIYIFICNGMDSRNGKLQL